MTPEARLVRNLKGITPASIWLTQGIVTAVDGLTCTVEIGDAQIEGIRLRASLTGRERQILTVPKVGSAVTLGSLSGDINQLVVLQVDEVESITVNGGHLGGLVKIQELTDKINALVDAFNRHTHTVQPGMVITPSGANTAPVLVPEVTVRAAKLDRNDFEDIKITH